MSENNSQLSGAQLQEIRTAVLGAAAKAPGALIGLGILFIILGMIGVAGQVMFSFVTINVLGAFLIIGGGLQFAHAITPIENPMRIRQSRRLIAQLMTEFNAR
jgi:uncharacterized membrane protein HdeD (DUF308 family)